MISHLETISTRGDFSVFKIKGKLASQELRVEIGRVRELFLRKQGKTSGKSILWSDLADLESTHYLVVREVPGDDSINREIVGIMSEFSQQADAVRARAVLPEYSNNPDVLDVLPYRQPAK